MRTQTIEGIAVTENGVCPFWEKSEKPGMAMLKECWFCKWSDFRDDPDDYKNIGTCSNTQKLAANAEIMVGVKMQPLELEFHGLNRENIEEYTQGLTSTREFDLSKQLALGCRCNGKPCGLAVVEVLAACAAGELERSFWIQ